MTDQPLKNLAFELLSTNQTLKAITTVLYETQSMENEAISRLLADELRLLESRIDRLHALTRPPKR